jgi:hypothetical protein
LVSFTLNLVISLLIFFEIRAVLPVAENTVAKALLEQMLGEGHEASGTVQDATTREGKLQY